MTAREGKPMDVESSISEMLCTSSMASGCEYFIKVLCPTSNTKSPLPLSKKEKKSSLHLFQLLIIDIYTQRRP